MTALSLAMLTVVSMFPMVTYILTIRIEGLRSRRREMLTYSIVVDAMLTLVIASVAGIAVGESLVSAMVLAGIILATFSYVESHR